MAREGSTIIRTISQTAIPVFSDAMGISDLRPVLEVRCGSGDRRER